MPRPTTLTEPWRSLAERLGGVQALADALHSAPRSVRQWAAGERRPRGPVLALLAQLLERYGLTPPAAPAAPDPSDPGSPATPA